MNEHTETAEAGPAESPVAAIFTRLGEQGVDIIELAVALLLGLGAIGGAWAGYQSGLWAGNSATAYGGAANITTQASTEFLLGVTIANRDSALDLQAKQLILDAATTEDPVERIKGFGMAKYLYARQMSEAGYLAIGLPQRFHGASDEVLEQMTDQMLLDSVDTELSEAYFDSVLADGAAMFEVARTKFDYGREANGHGDDYAFATVLFSISLFFAGITLVFKSRAKLAFLAVGGVMLLISLGYTAVLPDAKDAVEPSDTPAAAAAPAEPEAGA